MMSSFRIDVTLRLPFLALGIGRLAHLPGPSPYCIFRSGVTTIHCA